MLGPFRVSIVAGAVICAALLLAPPALADVFASAPSAVTSTLPTCIISSPDGAFVSTVVVRDASGIPVPGSSVVLDFSSCSLFALCTFPCAGCTGHASAHTVQKYTDLNGVASFDLRVGGACFDERVTVYADAVTLGTVAYSTLDQNGDLSVTGADMLRVQNAEFSGDLSADLDCSGTVTAADLAIVQAHVGVTCNGVVSTSRRTWGTLKGAYR